MTNKISTTIFLLAFVLLFQVEFQFKTAKAAGSTYYVDISNTAASDSRSSGSLEKPWKTLDYALKQLYPGDTLLVREGTYNNASIKLTANHSGQETAPITVQAYPGERVVLKNGGAIIFNGANWWVIDGLIFDSPRGQTLQLGMHKNLGQSQTVEAEHITIRNSKFTGGTQSAIVIEYASHILLENNHFYLIRPSVPFRDAAGNIVNWELNALSLRYKADDIQIKGNRFEDIGSDGVQVGSKYWVSGSSLNNIAIIGNEFWVNRPYTGILGNVGENGVDIKRSENVLIAQNIIHGFRPTTSGQDASGANGEGVVIHNDAQKITIEQNLFYDNTINLDISKGAQGTISGTKDMVVRNNIFREATISNGRGGYGLKVAAASQIRVYHNTFYDNSIAFRSYEVKASSFKNNAVSGGKIVINTTNAEWEADYNAWSDIAGSLPQTLKGLHDLYPADLSLDVEMQPLNQSPLLDSGQNVGVITDFAGKFRDDGTPDLGAFEGTRVSSATLVQLEPVETSINPGDQIEVDMTIKGAANLYGFQVNCSVDAAVLQWQTANFNDFFPDPLIGAKQIDVAANSWLGAVSQKNPAPAVSGDGSFATLTFAAVAPGTATINCEPLLSDRAGFALPVTMVTLPITVSPFSETLVNAFEGTITYQGRGEHAGLTVAATGPGQTIGQTGSTGQFRLNNLPPGTYNLTVDAALYLPSCLTTAIKETQLVTLPLASLAGGDLDDDQTIRIDDAALLGSNFGLGLFTDPVMNPRADINADGQVNIQDLAILGGNFGKQGCQEWHANLGN